MTQPVPLAEIWRGPHPESIHAGHAVICDASGDISEVWGDPDAVVDSSAPPPPVSERNADTIVSKMLILPVVGASSI